MKPTDVPDDIPEVMPPQDDDTRISVILDGRSATPKAVDFYKATPFQMMAIGEWLLLKAKQMITAAEQEEFKQISIARTGGPDASQILRGKR